MIDVAAATGALVDWWTLAGVDILVDDKPGRWLDDDVVATSSSARPNPVTLSRCAFSPPALSATVRPSAAAIELPGTLDGLMCALASGNGLPGTAYSQARLCPPVIPDAPVILVTDLPDPEDLAAGQWFAGPVGKLLDGMLRAIGMDRDQCQILPLAVTHPATGTLPEEDLATLTALAIHALGLCAAPRLVMFGNAASLALTAKSSAETRGNIQFLNHAGGKKAAVSTFHPRALFARPALKAECWRDLQLFAKDLPQ